MAGNGSRSQINTPSTKQPPEGSSTPNSLSEFDEVLSSDKNYFYGKYSDSDDEKPLFVKRRKTGSCTESAILTDLNVLDCPICDASLNSPVYQVYQCTNGHIACAPCCTKMANKCPTCRFPIGTIRCRAIEKVLESVKVKCRNTLYGCTQTSNNNKKLDHEKTCIYSPCSCPYSNCNYAGLPKSLYTHFGQTHPHSNFSFNTMKSISLDESQTQVFLQDSLQSTLFVLNRNVHSRLFRQTQSFVSVTCVAHDSQQHGAFTYDLTVVIDKDTRIKIEAAVVCVPKWTRISGKCLVLPGDLVRGLAPLKLELIIRRKPLIP